MRLLSTVSAVLFVSAGLVHAADEAPQVTGMSPKNAKPGEVLEISGLSLGANKIDEVYLTDHKFDMKVKVVEQKGELIRFRVPPFAKPGRMQLLLLTKGDHPLLLEQPAYVVIEDTSTEIGMRKE
jgi:hypothetical protein